MLVLSFIVASTTTAALKAEPVPEFMDTPLVCRVDIKKINFLIY
jgi:hypothetical protein